MFPNHIVRKLSYTALAVLLSVPALMAQQIPDYEARVGEKQYFHPQFHPRIIYQSLEELSPAAADEYARDLSRLGVVFNNGAVDPRTGRFGKLLPSHPLLPGTGVGNQLSWSSFMNGRAPANVAGYETVAWQAFVEYLQTHQGELDVNIHELDDPGRVTVHNNGDLIQIHATRSFDGINVQKSYINAVINHGNLTLMGIHGWGEVDVSTQPTLSEMEANDVLSAHLDQWIADGTWEYPELAIVPLARHFDPAQAQFGNDYEYRLVWLLRPAFSEDMGMWEGMVDAHSGELLAFQDQAHYLSDEAKRGAQATRTIEGGVLPVSNDGVAPDGIENTYPIPFADLTVNGTTYYSDTGGNLPLCVDGDVTTTLTGLYVALTDTCGAINETTSGGLLDLGEAPSVNSSDCDVQPASSPGNTRSARSGFYEVNRNMEIGRSHLPNNTWLTQPLPVLMNIALNCNATGGPGGLRFYQSGGGCANTGEIAGVFVHEWGHGMDGADATGGISNPGEGIADIYASLRLNVSCIGRNFRLGSNCGGYGDPCTACDGVRDIDWAKKSGGQPHDVTWIDNACGSGGSTPCGGSTHCEGHAYSESVYDLYNRDLQSEYGMSLDTARELTMRLNFIGAGGVSNWFQCSQGSGGCNSDSGYLNYLAADDDDGDLNNGTPHMEAIFAAFDRHGIACATPTVQDAGCAGTPTTAPTVMTTAQDRAVVLRWNAVAGAASYRVFRAEGIFDCDFGKVWIADTTDLEWTDEGLRNGFEYSYIVTAMGPGDTCFGPASACASVMPTAGPNFNFDTAGTLMVSGGDGDNFLDNCEMGNYTFSVQNIGTGAQTNVRIIGLVSPSHPETVFTTMLPSTITANLADGCSVTDGSFEFQAAGLSFNDTLVIEAEMTSDQLAPESRIATFHIQGTESDFRTLPTVTYTFETDEEGWTNPGGIYTRTGGSGAGGSSFFMASSANTPNQCDRALSPILKLSPTSTLSLWNQFDIEGGTPWYDRGNVSVVELNGGARTVVDPDGGRAYNASGTIGDFCTDGENGFAGTMSTWAESTWTAGALGSAGHAGDSIQIEVRYATDGGLHLGGLLFDNVTITNVDVQVADTQDDECSVDVCVDLALPQWPDQSILTFLDCDWQLPTTFAKHPEISSGGSGEE
jgi:hypothetical protein